MDVNVDEITFGQGEFRSRNGVRTVADDIFREHAKAFTLTSSFAKGIIPALLVAY